MAQPKITFNYKAMELSLQKSIEAASLLPARAIAKERFEEELGRLVESVIDDTASQEILAGPSAEKSKFIKGKWSKIHGGNLYSFIGFYAEEQNPINQLVSYLDKSFKIKLDAKLVKNKYIFRTVIPPISKIYKDFPLPGYFAGRSWIKAIESNMTNIVHYMKKSWPGSKSGEGIQIKNTIPGKIFKPKKDFFTSKYEDFIKRLRGR